MVTIKIVKPVAGSITILEHNPLRVQWTGPSNMVFGGFSLYCEACNRTLVSSASNPATFNISGLEASGHPGPYDISANIYVPSEPDPGPGPGPGHDIPVVVRTWLRTDPNDPNMGSTSPNEDHYGVIISKEVKKGGSFSRSVKVVLTATPKPGCKFLRWEQVFESGNVVVSTRSTFSQIITSHSVYDDYERYIAYFTNAVTLVTEVGPDGGGTVSPEPGTYEKKAGDSVTVSATPNPGYRFDRWSDGGAQTHDVVMDGDKKITAYFISLDAQYRITIHVKSAESASVYHDAYYTIHGEGMYKYGDQVEISVDDRGEKRFLKWEDGNTDRPRKVVVTSDMTFVAVMEGPTSVNVKLRINQTGIDPRSHGNRSGNIYRIYGSTRYDWSDTDQSVSVFGVMLEAVASGKTGGADGPTFRFIKWENGSTNPVRQILFPLEGQKIIAYFGCERLFYNQTPGNLMHGENGELMYSG